MPASSAFAKGWVNVFGKLNPDADAMLMVKGASSLEGCSTSSRNVRAQASSRLGSWRV
jgi:hypothetical protein